MEFLSNNQLINRKRALISNHFCRGFSFNDDELQHTQKAKERLFAGTTEHTEEIQEEHRKILETIENALHKLNSECTHIFEQHEIKVQQLTNKLMQLEYSGADKLDILNCRCDMLQAKREMLCWNKANKKTKVSQAFVASPSGCCKLF